MNIAEIKPHHLCWCLATSNAAVKHALLLKQVTLVALCWFLIEQHECIKKKNI
jgi:hypothetical protein